MKTDFKRSTEKVELKIHSDKTKILSNQRSNRQTEVKIDDIKIEVLPMSEKAQYLRQNHDVGAARDDRNKEPNQSSVGIIFGKQARVDIEIVSFTAQTAFIQHGHNAHADVRFWHLDTIA